MALCQIDDEADKSDIIFQDQVADTIMAFLPGIVSGLQEIAMESEIQNHKVTVVIRAMHIDDYCHPYFIHICEEVNYLYGKYII